MNVINTNIGAITAQANMNKINQDMNQAMSRLSSGLRINSAADDAAGMAISEKMTSQIQGLNQAIRNATDSKNLIDTSEGAHQEIQSMLQRLRELSIQSANDTNTSSDRAVLNAETAQLVTEINRVAETTTFNGMNILDGSFVGKRFQIGADAGQTIEVGIDSAAARDIGANTVRSTAGGVAGAALTDTTIAAGTTIDIASTLGTAQFTTTSGQSAEELVNAINGTSASTGVSGTATTKVALSGMSAAATVSMTLNGTGISAVGITDTADLTALADAINDQSGVTGVVATMGNTNAEIILTDDSGADIIFNNVVLSGTGDTLDMQALNADGSNAGASDQFTDTDVTGAVTGQVELTSAQSFSVGSSVTNTTAAFQATTTGSSLESVASIDLSTQQGAEAAIGILDVALEKISQSRSELGAVSNRLDSTISNLTNITVNVEAARSGIMDADFAKESSSLSKANILSQASTAMLAQANANSQNVLQLIQ
ncbi:MAG: flagellar filament protein [Rhodobacteraceae bacterium]|nr:flagellar filament protein [Paracoccaceae bacterium]